MSVRPRMGPVTGKCVTCGLSKGKCSGHFGHIELEEYVFHISWITSVIHWLKCICFTCGQSIIKETFDLDAIDGPRNRTMNKIVKHINNKCPKCGNKQQKYMWNKEKQHLLKNNEIYETTAVRNHLLKINPEILSTLNMSHPKDMLIKVLPVPPPNVRPPIMSGRTIRGEDDLTYRLLQVVRANDKLIKMKKNKRPDHVIAVARESLQMTITGYINHKKLNNTRKRSSKREYNSVAARLTGKEGRARGNLMSKRCDFTARTVITGDDNLGMNEVGVPISVAEKLTIPVKITAYNKRHFNRKVLYGSTFTSCAIKDILCKLGWRLNKTMSPSFNFLSIVNPTSKRIPDDFT